MLLPLPRFSALAIRACLSTTLALAPGLGHAFDTSGMVRDLQRAAERALQPEGSSPRSGAAAQRTAGLPGAAAGFQACLGHFHDQRPPVVVQNAGHGTLRALCYDRFAVLHASALKGPLFSAERLTADDLRAGAHLKRPDGRNAFFADARLPMKERAQPADYAGQGHLPKEERRDRGHLTPAREMVDERSMAQSFSLANVVPQNSVNNQRTWNKIEQDTRAYVMRARGPVTLITGAQYGPSPERMGPGGVAVPEALYKLVFDETTGRAWAHWLPNTAEARAGRPITLDELERRTGIRFLPGQQVSAAAAPAGG